MSFNLEKDEFFTFQKDEITLNQLLKDGDHNGLLDFVEEHDISFFFHAKIDEKKLTSKFTFLIIFINSLQ